jgi:hypothetical protein
MELGKQSESQEFRNASVVSPFIVEGTSADELKMFSEAQTGWMSLES